MKNYLESISAFWKDDTKTLSECSKKVYDFMILLKNHNENLFTEWYEKGASKKDALKNKIKIEQDFFSEALDKNWDKKFHDLGSRISYWTGNTKEGHSASISFRLGAYGDKSHIKSSCVINLPFEGEQMKFYLNQTNKENLIKLMYDYWQPNKILINGEEMGT